MSKHEKYDIIIIGSGLAGLTAGAKLAKEGKKILLVEQHSKLGGCATHFKRKNARFEVGLHEMDSAYEEPKKSIFQELGVYNHIKFVQLPEFFRFTNGRIDVIVPHGIEKATYALLESFPTDKKAIITFFKEISKIFSYIKDGKLESLANYSSSTVGDFLDTITNNEELKFTLTGNLGYYHDDPYTLSMIYFAVAQFSYFHGGGWFIKGGSQVLSDYLAQIIEENGGIIIRRHLVTEIITEGESCIGINYKIKLKKTEDIQSNIVQDFKAYGSVILVNASIPSVVNDLIPSLQGSGFQKKVNSMEIACSLFNIYLIFSEKPKNKYFSTFVVSEKLTKLKDLVSIEKSGDYSRKGFVFADYNTFDSQLNEKGTYIGVICAIDYLDNWIQLSEEEYNTKKENIANILIKRLDAVIPGIKNIIIHREIASPKTIVKYTMNPNGCVYGFSQIPDQIGPLRSYLKYPPLKNLYFASAWINSGGFSGAIMAGYSCAQKILKDVEFQ